MSTVPQIVTLLAQKRCFLNCDYQKNRTSEHPVKRFLEFSTELRKGFRQS